MDQRYSDWIAENVPENCTGMCRSTTHAMAVFFPELTLVRGQYHCLIWGRRNHWWLTTEDGGIIDPTAAQFPSRGGDYVPWIDGTPEPTGKCPNCGDYCWDGKDCCCDECTEEFTAYCGRLSRGMTA